mmetsp:Transcript_3124/g.7815  ORF Transcript_3124/g.7815 Transcript_3124/m.7815 type:complete len:247 (-) Transcript_3124:799-1539(-)
MMELRSSLKASSSVFVSRHASSVDLNFSISMPAPMNTISCRRSPHSPSHSSRIMRSYSFGIALLSLSRSSSAASAHHFPALSNEKCRPACDQKRDSRGCESSQTYPLLRMTRVRGLSDKTPISLRASPSGEVTRSKYLSRFLRGMGHVLMTPISLSALKGRRERYTKLSIPKRFLAVVSALLPPWEWECLWPCPCSCDGSVHVGSAQAFSCACACAWPCEWLSSVHCGSEHSAALLVSLSARSLSK